MNLLASRHSLFTMLKSIVKKIFSTLSGNVWCICFIVLSMLSCKEKASIGTLSSGASKEKSSPELVVPDSENVFVTGQTLYAPVYSELYLSDENSKVLLSATLSIRNTDPTYGLVLESVDYYDTHGKKVKSELSKPIFLPALATKDYVVPLVDVSGGTGANYLVTWKSAHAVSQPLVETIMISAVSGRGISFATQAQIVRTWPSKTP